MSRISGTTVTSRRSAARPSIARRLTVLAALLLVLVTGLAGAQPAAVHGSDGPTHAEQLGATLQKVLDNQRTKINIPGAAATVILPDGSRWSGASGRAVISPKAQVTRQTPFVIGSITKTFVAALFLQLAEEDALSLDDALSNWMPDYPNAANLTLRQLLSHTSGVHNYFEHPDYNSLVFKRPTYNWAPQEILDTFKRSPYFAPGSSYRYSNTNFVLLGLVAEQVTGNPLGDELRARFGQPLGLTRTSFQGDGPPPSSSAKGYLLKPAGFKEISDSTGYRPTRSAATVAWAAGDGVATADDIATWARALYGGSVLETASLDEMLDYPRYAGGGRYGLGVRTRTYDGRRMYGHTGSLRGYVAAMWHLPAQNVTVVVMTNRGRIDANVIADRLLRRVFTDTIKPTVPTDLAGTAQSKRYVALSWTASTDNMPGTIRYRVFRNGKAIGTQTTSTSYLDRPTVGTHRYQVRAIDAAGNKSALSPSISVTAVKVATSMTAASSPSYWPD